MKSVAAAWRRHPWLTTAFALALVVTLALTVRLTMFTIYWADPAHRDRALEGWMTPGYIAHSWDLGRDALRSALGADAQPGEHLTLEEIAERRGEPLEALIARVEAAIAAERAGER